MTKNANGSKNSKSTSRIKNLANEGDRLDKTLAMTQDIISMGQGSSMSMQAQN